MYTFTRLYGLGECHQLFNVLAPESAFLFSTVSKLSIVFSLLSAEVQAGRYLILSEFL